MKLWQVFVLPPCFQWGRFTCSSASLWLTCTMVGSKKQKQSSAWSTNGAGSLHLKGQYSAWLFANVPQRLSDGHYCIYQPGLHLADSHYSLFILTHVCRIGKKSKHRFSLQLEENTAIVSLTFALCLNLMDDAFQKRPSINKYPSFLHMWTSVTTETKPSSDWVQAKIQMCLPWENGDCGPF